MLDLITLISTMGVQQELNEAQHVNKTSRVIREENGEDDDILGQAADQLSSAFESIEGALCHGVQSIFGKEEEDATSSSSPLKKVP
mmetsp:Transcript_108165/g.171058  ORF Transcript_108165/g.171058 Transcript_108165/m.171058 type:complete len:86 (-) Transcript_108165:67-324(-)